MFTNIHLNSVKKNPPAFFAKTGGFNLEVLLLDQRHFLHIDKAIAFDTIEINARG